MQSSHPLTREIVLIGGGHSHALLLRRWGMSPLPGARLTLINPTATAPYTGMLPGFVAGHYPRDALEIDLVRLARFAGARMIFGAVTALDRIEKKLTLPGRPNVAYDIASFDIGITSDMPNLPGFTKHGVAAKPLGPFAARWHDHLSGDSGPVVVIGAGVAGVELALAMRHALGGREQVSIVEASTALQGIGSATRNRLLQSLRQADVALYENETAKAVHPDCVELSSGVEIPATLTVGAAGARPFHWLKETGLSLTDGFITVDQTLRSISDQNIFAVGDCAHLSHAPRPKAGVFAVRAAPSLTHNLKAAAADQPLSAFRPQRQYLKLISLGNKSAIADKWGRSIGGTWAWHWKDRIDRAFMSRLTSLPDMTQTPPKRRASGMHDSALPLCGGCGAKVSASVLDGMTGTLADHKRTDVITGPGDDAAVLKVGGKSQVITTDHLRCFWEDPYVMGRITALHALGDVWAMGAAPQAVLAHITLPQLGKPLQRDWLREIMSAAQSVFASEGAALAGGHTTLGAELTLGFTITGLVERPITQSGARPGDVLLLSRAIGSGTLLAAEMAGKAQGPHIADLLERLSHSQGDAARILAPATTAMTDVTGFGLFGHALRMAQASDVSILIDSQTVPLFEGAEDLTAQGIRSSLWSDNRSMAGQDVPETPRAALMFDPQTAGGLLAAVSPDEAAQLCKTLQDLGHPAAVIGEVTERRETPVTLS